MIRALSLIAALGSMGCSTLLDGEHWRDHVLNDISPHWLEKGYVLNLSRRWEPQAPAQKIPAMISRNVYGFCCAYLLSGDERYLDAARRGVDDLLQNGWDEKYGGWFDSIEPKSEKKSAPLDLYTNVGLTLYYFTTGDDRALARVNSAIGIRQSNGLDKTHGGYFQVLNRDLTPADRSKGKHAHYGYVGSLLLNHNLASGEAKEWTRQLMDLSRERMTQNGWFVGYPPALGESWSLPASETLNIGAQLTATWALLRLHQQTGRREYADHARTLGDEIIAAAWDPQTGAWLEVVEKAPPHRPTGKPTVRLWIQVYGAFIQLNLFHLTRDEKYLRQFERTEEFYERHMVDREFGGVFKAVDKSGAVVEERKSSAWQVSYHETEHGYLNYLYLNLYVNRKPVTLHFHYATGRRTVRVCPVDDPGVRLVEVRINGRPHPAFDPAARTVALPAASDLKVQVTLSRE